MRKAIRNSFLALALCLFITMASCNKEDQLLNQGERITARIAPEISGTYKVKGFSYVKVDTGIRESPDSMNISLSFNDPYLKIKGEDYFCSQIDENQYVFHSNDYGIYHQLMVQRDLHHFDWYLFHWQIDQQQEYSHFSWDR